MNANFERPRQFGAGFFSTQSAEVAEKKAVVPVAFAADCNSENEIKDNEPKERGKINREKRHAGTLR